MHYDDQHNFKRKLQREEEKKRGYLKLSIKTKTAAVEMYINTEKTQREIAEFLGFPRRYMPDVMKEFHVYTGRSYNRRYMTPEEINPHAEKQNTCNRKLVLNSAIKGRRTPDLESIRRRC